MRFTTRNSIQRKLFIGMLACVLVPMLLLISYLLYLASSINAMNDRAAETQIRENMYQALRGDINTLDSAAYNIFYHYYMLQRIVEGEREGIVAELRTTMVDIAALYDTFAGNHALWGLAFYTTDGNAVYRYLTSSGQTGLSQSIPPPSLATLEKISFLNLEPSGNIMLYRYPVIFRGTLAGMLMFSLEAEPFRSAIETLNTMEKGRVLITSRQGHILYDTLDSAMGENIANLSFPGFKRITQPMTEMDADLIYLYQDSLATRFSLVVTPLAVLLAFVAALCVSYALSRRLSSPIVALAKAIRRVERGSLDEQIQMERSDEIGDLAHSFNAMTATLQQQIASTIQAEVQIKDAQIGALQAQISPHFLHNTLQAITEMAHQNSAGDITDICKALSDMYRYNMYVDQRYARLEEEVMHVRNYMLIISKRYPGMIRFRVRISEELQPLKVPKLILQPIVENAVEHGLLTSPEEERLLIIDAEADEVKGILTLWVRNNGLGLSPEALEHINDSLYFSYGKEQSNYESIGLYNVMRRIHLLCGDHYGLRLESPDGSGVITVFTLPLRREERP